MDDGRQPGGVTVACGDQFGFGGDAVLLLERIEGVETRRELRQPFGVGVDPFAVGGRGVVDVFQFFEHRVYALGVLPGGGVVFADAYEVVFRVFEQGENPRFVGVECVAERGEDFADAVGVFQYGKFRFGRGLLAFAEVGGGQLFALETQPLLVAAAVGGRFAQGCELAPQFGKPGVLRRVLREQPAVSGHGVERRGAELLRGENQVLVLGVYVDQAGAEFAQLRELDRNVVDEGAALAGRGYHARNVRFGSIVEVVLVEERLHTAARKVESPFDHAVARRVFHGRAVVLGSEQQAQSTEQDGFAGSRLTRDDVQVRVQLHFELFDKRVILNRQTT